MTPARSRPASSVPWAALLLLGLLLADKGAHLNLTGVMHQGGVALAAMIPDPPTPRATRRRPTNSPPPSSAARSDIPPGYLRLYRQAGAGERWPDRSGHRYAAWAVLAGIGAVESGHGQSRAPGVRSGVNAFGCCAGPMQFNLVNGPPSTWDAYGRGGSPYDPADAIPAARRLLLANGARRDLDGAVWNYNHSWSYVATVKAHARRYQDRRS